MLAFFQALVDHSSTLVVLVCCLVVPYFMAVGHISKKLGRYALLGDLNHFRKRGSRFATLGYWSAWIIWFLGALLVFPPLVIALNR
jgi:ABC-type Fe3+ transport system permease subunit